MKRWSERGALSRGIAIGGTIGAVVIAGIVAGNNANNGGGGGADPYDPPAGTELCAGGADEDTLASAWPTLPSLATVQATFPNITGVVNVPAGDHGVDNLNPWDISFNYRLTGDKFYWFAPGVHTIGTDPFKQIDTDNEFSNHDGMVFAGGGTLANPAILDGQNLNKRAFTGESNDITIMYLTIRHFVANTDDTGIVNLENGADWTVKYNNIGPNAGFDVDDPATILAYNKGGAAVGVGPGSTIEYNCLKQNAQYAIQGSMPATRCATPLEIPSWTNGGSGTLESESQAVCKIPGIVIDHNEMVENNYATLQNSDETGSLHAGFDNFPDVQTNIFDPVETWGPNDCGGGTTGCNNGFSGAIKAWAWEEAQITDNWIHDNHSQGVWADTINIDLDITGNLIENNWGIAVFYEVSYNGTISDNVMINNAWVHGSRNNFPVPAIYISNSGYDSLVTPNNGSGALQITDNILIDNWNGVTLWDQPSRFCSYGNPTVQCTQPITGLSPQPSGGTSGTCTTLTGTASSATVLNHTNQGLLASCRWMTKNILIDGNTFKFDPDNLDPQSITPFARDGNCDDGPDSTMYCGYMSVVSESGGGHWPNDLIAHSVTWDQGNTWTNNCYEGPWYFDTNEANQTVHSTMAPATWQTTVGSRGGSGVNTEDHPAQDTAASGSTFTTCP